MYVDTSLRGDYMTVHVEDLRRLHAYMYYCVLEYITNQQKVPLVESSLQSNDVMLPTTYRPFVLGVQRYSQP